MCVFLAGGTMAVEFPLTVENDDPNGKKMVRMPLEAGDWAGRLVRFSTHASGEVGVPTAKWQGGKFMLRTVGKDGKSAFPSAFFPNGAGLFEDREFVIRHFVDWDVKSAELFFGFQAAAGKLTFKDLSLETEATFLDLRPAANMGYVDEVAGDGKGGWSDQGPENDARGFRRDTKNYLYGGVPFGPLDPAKNGGRSCIVLKGGNFSSGPESATVSGGKAGGKYLYLLHTLTWAGGGQGVVGSVEVTGVNGYTQVLTVRESTDVGNWWTASRMPNGFPAATWKTAKGGLVSMFASKWALDKRVGTIDSVTFKTLSPAMWIVVAASVSDRDFAFPETVRRVIAEGDRWRRAANDVPSSRIEPGSILDLSFVHPCGADRVVLKDGRFVNQKTGKTLRFTADAHLGDLFSEDPEEWCAEAKRRGFNMVRLHYLDKSLCCGAKNPLEFEQKKVDFLMRFVTAANRYGIYINFDSMASHYGWTPGNDWAQDYGGPRQPEEWVVGKRNIYFSEKARSNWADGVAKLLALRNPHTGRLLGDEPCMLLSVAYNEQEFAFSDGGGTAENVLAEWRAFLKRRYRNDIARLNAAWGRSYASFDEAETFGRADCSSTQHAKGRDTMEFLDAKQTWMQDWYVRKFHERMPKGYIAAFNMAQSLRLLSLRAGSDYVALNAYHAHPFGDTCEVSSTLEMRGSLARAFAASHLAGKPLVATEYGLAFWNPYRYEQGFLMGGYGALNGFDGLTAFDRYVPAGSRNRRIATFNGYTDPVLLAANVVTTLLFGRGDVKESPVTIDYTIDRGLLKRTDSSMDAMSTEQSSLALVGEVRVWVDGEPPKSAVSYSLPAAAGNAILFHREGFQQSVEKGPQRGVSAGEIVSGLRRKGLLGAGNRSDPSKGLYESVTGELALDTKKARMTVNTPRTQGVAARAPFAVAELADVAVRRATRDGCVFVSAMDGMEPIRSAKRLLVGYITNALNAGMEFDGDSYRRVLNKGKAPALLETGTFEVEIATERAADFACWAVDFSGRRFAEILLKRTGRRVTLSVDTAKLPVGATFYFELGQRE